LEDAYFKGLIYDPEEGYLNEAAAGTANLKARLASFGSTALKNPSK
jgi:hypothetical protein